MKPNKEELPLLESLWAEATILDEDLGSGFFFDYYNGLHDGLIPAPADTLDRIEEDDEPAFGTGEKQRTTVIENDEDFRPSVTVSIKFKYPRGDDPKDDSSGVYLGAYDDLGGLVLHMKRLIPEGPITDVKAYSHSRRRKESRQLPADKIPGVARLLQEWLGDREILR